MPDESQICVPRRRSTAESAVPRGFTLVELLVVIGIIALLISILLPALNHARQAAQRVQCSARLHNIMVAAAVHAADHRGFYPLAGLITVGDNTDESTALGDPGAQNYSYLSLNTGSFANTRLLAPITLALGAEMGHKELLLLQVQTTVTSAFNDGTGVSFSQNFICPSQGLPTTTQYFLAAHSCLYITANSTGGLNGEYAEPQSFVYNEAVLGFNDSRGRLRGRASSVRQPGLTMFAMDGIGDATNAPRYSPPGSPAEPSISGFGLYTVYNAQNFPPITLSDAVSGVTNLAGPYGVDSNKPGVYDSSIYAAPGPYHEDVSKRHQGLINIAFCDGHVDSRHTKAGPNPKGSGFNPIHPDLANVFIMAQ